MVVLDDEGRENEGDLIAAASTMTPERMAFLIRHTRYAISFLRAIFAVVGLKHPLMAQSTNPLLCCSRSGWPSAPFASVSPCLCGRGLHCRA